MTTKNTLDTGTPARLKRVIRWYDGFALAVAVPALLIYSAGPMAGMLGIGSIIVWVISMTIAFFLVFGYAELAGLFPGKTGGFGVFQYIAWRNSDFAKRHRHLADVVGVIGVWGYWWAWSPVIAIGGLTFGTYMRFMIPSLPDTLFFQPTQIALGFGFMILLYIINYFGITGGAALSKILAILTIVPLGIIAVAPWFIPGLIHLEYFNPFLPTNWATGELEPSWFTWPAIYGILGGLFIAAWCDYAYECAACYTAEYKDPQKETIKAISASTALNAFYYILLPITLIATLPVSLIRQDPYIAFPELGVLIMGEVGGPIVIIMLLAAVLLMMNQATNGGARALYQMAEDNHHPKQFGILNRYKIPSVGMAFDIAFNYILMWLGNPIVILAASAVGYIIANVFGNLSVSFMRRKFPDAPRPFRVPKWMWPITMILFAPNAVFMIAAPTFGGWKGTVVGFLISLVILLFYSYRQFIQNRPGWRPFGESLMPEYMRAIARPDGTIQKNSLPDLAILSLVILASAGIIIIAALV